MRNVIHRGTVDLESASSGRSVWQRLLVRVGLASCTSIEAASVDTFQDVIDRLRDRPNEVPDFMRLTHGRDLAKLDPLPKAIVKGPANR